MNHVFVEEWNKVARKAHTCTVSAVVKGGLTCKEKDIRNAVKISTWLDNNLACPVCVRVLGGVGRVVFLVCLLLLLLVGWSFGFVFFFSPLLFFLLFLHCGLASAEEQHLVKDSRSPCLIPTLLLYQSKEEWFG